LRGRGKKEGEKGKRALSCRKERDVRGDHYRVSMKGKKDREKKRKGALETCGKKRGVLPAERGLGKKKKFFV